MIDDPNYIPVKNMQDFNYDVLFYYNQYYAPAYVTQQRRILRNYINNNNTIKQYNRNPFINNKGKTFNFLYTYAQNYMFVQDSNSTDIYIWIGSGWCKMKHFNNKLNCNEIKIFIQNNAPKSLYL